MTTTAIATAAIRTCQRPAGGGGAKSMATKSSGCDTAVTSWRRGQAGVPTHWPQKAQFGEVCLPREVRERRDQLDGSCNGELEPLSGTLDAVVDGGEAPSHHERGRRADGHI